MNAFSSDALVFFGATGDLAYKKIFPALLAMVKHGHLGVPVIGVGRSSRSIDQLRNRAKESVEKHGDFDSEAFEKLSHLLRYVHGDYHDPATFEAIRKELGSAQRPRTISPFLRRSLGRSWKNSANRGAPRTPASLSKSPSE